LDIRKETPRKAQPNEFVALDVEVFGQQKGRLHRPEGTFACLSIAMNDGVWQVYDVTDLPKVFDVISDGIWVFHNAIYDIRQLRRWVPLSKRRIWDTLLVDRVLWGGYYSTFSLADLARRYLDIRLEKETRDEFATATFMTEEMKQYAALDATITLDIALYQQSLDADLRAYWNIDLPALWAILDIRGVKVNVSKWLGLAKQFAYMAKMIQNELGVNVMSPRQVLRVAKQHGLHMQNTRKETLAQYIDHPFVAGVLEGRMYRKAVSTYGAKWIEKYVEEDGLVYADWKCAGTETGRMSCASPNLQQIPARKLPQYRTLFIPRDNYHTFLVTDVSQQEPRVLAYESKDKELIHALATGQDLHLYVARAIFDDDTITKDDPRRRLGKDINLGLSYGLTAYGLAQRTNLSEAEAQELLDAYFRRFKGVRSWISRQRSVALKREYVTTASGRRIWLNLYNNQWENNAINAPIQGGAADHTKRALFLVWDECQKRNWEFPVVMAVHDEIVMDVPKEMLKKMEKLVVDAWLQAAEELFPGIPFKVSADSGPNWACKK
jgi:DNA polymerase-1